jgi:hypothetical protein
MTFNGIFFVKPSKRLCRAGPLFAMLTANQSELKYDEMLILLTLVLVCGLFVGCPATDFWLFFQRQIFCWYVGPTRHADPRCSNF